MFLQSSVYEFFVYFTTWNQNQLLNEKSLSARKFSGYRNRVTYIHQLTRFGLMKLPYRSSLDEGFDKFVTDFLDIFRTTLR